MLQVIEKYKQTWYLCNYFFLIVNVPPNKVDENEQVDDIKYFLLTMPPYNIIIFEEGEFCTNSSISTNFLKKKNSLCSHLEPVINKKVFFSKEFLQNLLHGKISWISPKSCAIFCSHLIYSFFYGWNQSFSVLQPKFSVAL